MIIEKLLDFFFAIASDLLEWLPSLDWSINTNGWARVGDILSMVCYLLPLNTVTAIISLIASIAVFRITVAFIKTIWDFIPFV